MEIEYDPLKNERNIRERGLSFERAKDFDFRSAKSTYHYRNGEWRVEATGYLDDRLHVVCFTVRPPSVRIISFRKANAREAKRHGFTLRR